MCVEPNKIFTPRHYKLNRQSSQEKFGIKKKINCLIFFRGPFEGGAATIVECGPFEGGAGANVSNTFLLNRTLLGFLGYFLKLNTSC